ncbi:dethiobiotin synthase [Chitinimonas lacunae]|uniref:ATP-dependent dethiobiotin synthetase BioD n=1 Tax=Chitinimonas lacunae TaxID=1963018 RepID=A0ABV8MQ86_9NEIS
MTGTDTSVGKTVATVALLRSAARLGLRAVGMKPVASGCERLADGSLYNEDVAAHRAASVAAPAHWTNPYAFELPLSPHLAARAAGVTVEPARLVEAYDGLRSQTDLVLVEGAGGWLAPLDETRSMADLARLLDLPVILVVGLRLGCLNHARLSAAAIEAAGCRFAGWIGNRIDPAMAAAEENIDYLTRCLPGPCLGVLPYFHSPEQKLEPLFEQRLDIALKSIIN